MSGPATGFAVCVVHYRDPRAVARLLGGVAEWSVAPGLVVVVDNSDDLPDVPTPDAGTVVPAPVVVLRPGANVGYAAAANLGLREASARGFPRLLLLTQDCRLAPDTAERLDSCLDDDAVAVAAPVLAFASRPGTVFSAGGTLSGRAHPRHLAHGEPLAAVGDGVREVAWADGACLMIRTGPALALGGFPEEYFLYVEEIAFLHRVRACGARVVVAQNAVAWQEPGNYTAYLRYRNLRYFSGRTPGFRVWPWWAALVRDVPRALGRRSPAALAWAVRGVVDARRGRMGPPPRGLLSR